MRKILITVFLICIASGCNKNSSNTAADKDLPTEKKSDSIKKVDKPVNQENLFGRWVNSDDGMGFEIKIGGKAASINMANLDYNSWRLDGHRLILNSTSKGVSNPVTVDEVFLIRQLTHSKLMVSPSDNPSVWWTYTKQ